MVVFSGSGNWKDHIPKLKGDFRNGKGSASREKSGGTRGPHRGTSAWEEKSSTTIHVLGKGEENDTPETKTSIGEYR